MVDGLAPFDILYAEDFSFSTVKGIIKANYKLDVGIRSPNFTIHTHRSNVFVCNALKSWFVTSQQLRCFDKAPNQNKMAAGKQRFVGTEKTRILPL